MLHQELGSHRAQLRRLVLVKHQRHTRTARPRALERERRGGLLGAAEHDGDVGKEEHPVQQQRREGLAGASGTVGVQQRELVVG